MKNEYILKLTEADIEEMVQETAVEEKGKKLTRDDLDLIFKKLGNVLAEEIYPICRDLINDLETKGETI